MKFGKYLESRQLELPEYLGYFINYKSLKKLIKQLSDGNTTNSESIFFFRVERELEKVNDFYIEKQSDLKLKLDILINKKFQLIKYYSNENLGSTKEKSISFQKLYNSFNQYSKILVRLSQFVELNETGFRKILKKWDKRLNTHFKEVYLSNTVNVQPVFHKEEINNLNDLVVNSILELEAFSDGETSIHLSGGKDNDPAEKHQPGAIDFYKKDIGLSISNSSHDSNLFQNTQGSANGESIDDLYSKFVNIANAQHNQLILLSKWLTELKDLKDPDVLMAVFFLSIDTNIKDIYLINFYNYFKEFISLTYVDVYTGRNFLHQIAINKVVKLLDVFKNNKFDNNNNDIMVTNVNSNDDNPVDTQKVLSLTNDPAILNKEINTENSNISSKNFNTHQDDEYSRYFLIKTLLLDTIGYCSTSGQESYKSLLSMRDINNKIPLHYAAQFGKFQLLKLLCDEYTEGIFAVDDNTMTPLLLAIENNELDSVFYLLNAENSIYLKNNTKDEDVKMKLEENINKINNSNHDDDEDDSELNLKATLSPLIYACKFGNYNIVNALLNFSSTVVNVNEKSVDGMLSLHVAARYGHGDIIKLLCTKGAANANQINESSDELIKSSIGNSATTSTASIPTLTVVESMNKEKQKKEKKGWTPIFYCAVYGHAKAANALIECGADILIVDSLGYNALYYACLHGKVDVLNVLYRQTNLMKQEEKTCQVQNFDSQLGATEDKQSKDAMAPLNESPLGEFSLDNNDKIVLDESPDARKPGMQAHMMQPIGKPTNVNSLFNKLSEASSKTHNPNINTPPSVPYASKLSNIGLDNEISNSHLNSTVATPPSFAKSFNTNTTTTGESTTMTPGFNQKINIDTIPSFSLPPPIIPLRKYGHNFLEKKTFLQLCFGTGKHAIKLYNTGNSQHMHIAANDENDNTNNGSTDGKTFSSEGRSDKTRSAVFNSLLFTKSMKGADERDGLIVDHVHDSGKNGLTMRPKLQEQNSAINKFPIEKVTDENENDDECDDNDNDNDNDNNYYEGDSDDSGLKLFPGRITVTTTSSDNTTMIPRNVLLPIDSQNRFLNFHLNETPNNDFTINFELYPTFGTKLIAKGIVTARDLFGDERGNKFIDDGSGYVRVVLFDSRLKNVGELVFLYSVIYSYYGTRCITYDCFEQFQLSNSKINDYNNFDNSNSLFTFIVPSNLFGDFIKMNICMLNDGTPCVCPRNYVELGITEQVSGIKISLLNLNGDELYAITQKQYCLKTVMDELLNLKELFNNQTISKHAYMLELKKILNIAYIPLNVFLAYIPADINLNFDIFYPTKFELQNFFKLLSINNYYYSNSGTSIEASDLNSFIDKILTIIFSDLRNLNNSNSTFVKLRRPIVFSSFNPTVCKILNWKQPTFPVLFSMACTGFNISKDEFEMRSCNGYSIQRKYLGNKNRSKGKEEPWSRSIEEAIQFTHNNNLFGLMLPSKLLSLSERLCETIMDDKGLVLIGYDEDLRKFNDHFFDYSGNYSDQRSSARANDNVETFNDPKLCRLTGTRKDGILSITSSIDI